MLLCNPFKLSMFKLDWHERKEYLLNCICNINTSRQVMMTSFVITEE